CQHRRGAEDRQPALGNTRTYLLGDALRCSGRRNWSAVGIPHVMKPARRLRDSAAERRIHREAGRNLINGEVIGNGDAERIDVFGCPRSHNDGTEHLAGYRMTEDLHKALVNAEHLGTRVECQLYARDLIEDSATLQIALASA